MKKHYLLIPLLLLFFFSNAQEDVHVTLGKCRRNAVSGHKAFNLGNLKYYARRSKSAIDQLVKNSEFIDCNTAFDLSQSVVIHLESALLTEDFATAKAHLIKVEETSTEIFNAFNLCTNNEIETVSIVEVSESVNLSEIEQQQALLKQQQEVLEQKERELKLKLAEQNKKKLELKKQSFITTNQKVIETNTKAYNNSLKACECNATLKYNTEEISSLLNKTLDDLKDFYLSKTIEMTEDYMALLNECKLK
ncbi:hypothetical protein [Winogradskyella jejuensis]|uniref:DUF4398 domain-containing protein n=1 Tax=Winogradskyella jejuensis TaxID=1089305 RepID=A0A1M5JYJ0_9FLAO|nr:hypothetical protein [Winogradskyella jejuensis]SHG45578.1 hypothetical protein SAMN05444148_0179 [Winogradskyella jejuensis]